MTLATNKVARITGVIRGLGRSTAIALARGGVDVSSPTMLRRTAKLGTMQAS